MSLRIRSDSELDAANVNFVQHVIISSSFETAFWGMYLVLMVASTYALFLEGLSRSRARQMLLLCTIIMFSAATVTMFLDVATHVVDMLLYNQTVDFPEELLIHWDMVGNVMVRIVFILSDIIVVWRAWVLWEQSPAVKMALATCFLADFVSATVDLTLTLILDVRDDGEQRSGTQSLLLTIPVLITNVLAVAMISYKTWQYRQSRKMVTSEDAKHGARVGRILDALIGAGVVYCIAWALFIVSTFGDLHYPGNDVLIDIIPQIAGIYPTVIIILATFERHRSLSPRNKISAPMGSLHFARPPMRNNIDTTFRSANDVAMENVRGRYPTRITPSVALTSQVGYSSSGLEPATESTLSEEDKRSGNGWIART